MNVSFATPFISLNSAVACFSVCRFINLLAGFFFFCLLVCRSRGRNQSSLQQVTRFRSDPVHRSGECGAEGSSTGSHSPRPASGLPGAGAATRTPSAERGGEEMYPIDPDSSTWDLLGVLGPNSVLH